MIILCLEGTFSSLTRKWILSIFPSKSFEIVEIPLDLRSFLFILLHKLIRLSFINSQQQVVLQIPLTPRFYFHLWILRLLFSNAVSFVWGRHLSSSPKKRNAFFLFLKKSILFLFLYTAPPFKSIYACGNLNILFASRFTRNVISIPNIEYISILNSPSFLQNPSPKLLYVDQGHHSHPDLNLLGMTEVDPFIHYREISSFLSTISTKYNIPIVFSLHPRAHYADEILHLFSSFSIVNGSCSELSTSSHVLTTSSSIIELALSLNRKVALVLPSQVRLSLPTIAYDCLSLAYDLSTPLFRLPDYSQLDDFMLSSTDKINTAQQSFVQNFIFSHWKP